MTSWELRFSKKIVSLKELLIKPPAMKQLLLKRTKQLGLDIFILVDELPSKPSSWTIAKQIIRSSTSVGANYRAACRAKSLPDFINKLKIVEEEADETQYWLELLEEGGIVNPNRIEPLKNEVNEIIAMVVSSIKTSRIKLVEK